MTTRRNPADGPSAYLLTRIRSLEEVLAERAGRDPGSSPNEAQREKAKPAPTEEGT